MLLRLYPPQLTGPVSLNPPRDSEREDEERQILNELSEHGDVPRGGEDVVFEIRRDEGEEGRDHGEERRGWRSGLGGRKEHEKGRKREREREVSLGDRESGESEEEGCLLGREEASWSGG